MRWVALCLMVTVATPAASETFDIGGRTVTLELPAEYCPLDRSHPMDQTIFAYTEDVNTEARYLIHAAPCWNLEAWHDGRAQALGRYLSVVTPLVDGKPQTLDGLTRSRFLREVKQTLPATDIDEIEADLKRMYEGKADITVGDLQMLGVIEEDENALYIALVATAVSVEGEIVAPTVWAVTSLNSAIVFVYLTSDMAPGIHAQLAGELAPYIAELVRLNP